jgi:hypothetical protein
MSDGCGAQSIGFQEQIEERRPRGKKRACSADEPVDGIQAAVSDYIEHHRARAARELEYFSRVLRSDEEAVSRVALALLPSGKRHPHQYRVPRVALQESRRVLLENLDMLRQATSFDELFAVVEDLTEPIKGIGELTVYDTALRIGAHFGRKPTRVYLHAGTRNGAQALGFDPRRQTIEMDELPAPMQQLTAREAEDLLCIYKDWIG